MKLASRVGGASGSLSIRGAADTSARPRRTIISLNGSAGSSVSTPHRGPRIINAVEIWREFVQSRWNAEARFLNLEVSGS